MRKFFIVIIILFGVCLPKGWSASRLSPEKHHFISAWGEVGYANLLNTGSLKTQFGCSPALGVGYRYLYNGFIMQLGVEGQYMCFTQKSDDAAVALNMLDTEGDPFVLHATMREYKDVTQVMNVNIPLMLGYEYRRFYFMAGASLGLNVWSRAKASALLDTEASYSLFIDQFAQMPNHQLQTGQSLASNPYRIKWINPSVNAHVEIGGRVDHFSLERGANVKKHTYRIYVAAFAVYGLTNVSSNKSDDKIMGYHQKAGEPLTFDLVPVMKSNLMNGIRVNPLVVGIKATVIWQLPGKKECVLCKD